MLRTNKTARQGKRPYGIGHLSEDGYKGKDKKCSCQHNVGHTCNARFCWCYKHWEEGVKAGFIRDVGVIGQMQIQDMKDAIEDFVDYLTENYLRTQKCIYFQDGVIIKKAPNESCFCGVLGAGSVPGAT